MSTFKHITHFTCYMSHVICYMPQVIWYMSHVSCCTSYVIYCMLEMPCILFWFHPNISHMSTCHMLHVTCYMSHVTCNMTHFTYHMPFITCPWKCHGYMHAVLSAFNLCHISICHMSYVTCDMWHVTCHMSLVTCHMSQVMCHMSHVIFHMSLDMLCIVQSPWCWPNKMTIYRAPRQPKRSKIKKWSSSVPRPDTQNENELWILIY